MGEILVFRERNTFFREGEILGAAPLPIAEWSPIDCWPSKSQWWSYLFLAPLLNLFYPATSDLNLPYIFQIWSKSRWLSFIFLAPIAKSFLPSNIHIRFQEPLWWFYLFLVPLQNIFWQVLSPSHFMIYLWYLVRKKPTYFAMLVPLAVMTFLEIRACFVYSQCYMFLLQASSFCWKPGNPAIGCNSRGTN